MKKFKLSNYNKSGYNTSYTKVLNTILTEKRKDGIQVFDAGPHVDNKQLPDSIRREYFQKNERGDLVKHREDGPAIKHIQKGNFARIMWMQNDVFHRNNGPAILEFNITIHGWFRTYDWWKHGKRHREDGPAILGFNDQGIYVHRYFLEGVELSKDEWSKIILMQVFKLL